MYSDRDIFRYTLTDDEYDNNVLKDAFPVNQKISLIYPEGTYLAWLDCKKHAMTDSGLDDLFINKAGVHLHLGSIFRAGGSGFVRMNIACPRSILLEAIARIENAIQKEKDK